MEFIGWKGDIKIFWGFFYGWRRYGDAGEQSRMDHERSQ